MGDPLTVSVVVPVYNEEKNIPPLIERLRTVFNKIGCRYEIIFCMDPGTDKTAEVIQSFREKDQAIKLLVMSRRFGQPACTLAGIYYCTGDVCVVIDADLQDPPELMVDMVAKWREGYHVVYAQRTSRKGETLVKRAVAFMGYWLIDNIAEVKIPRNTGDFRLLSREVIERLKELKEHDGFLRGLVAYVGYNQIAIPYNRDPRLAGKGNYNRFLGSLWIGLNGVLGFSKYPLHLISILGLAISTLSFFVGLTYIYVSLMGYRIPWGNPSLVIFISFLSGIQLLSLGIIAQYFARIYDEIKKRPFFIVQEAHGFNKALSSKQISPVNTIDGAD